MAAGDCGRVAEWGIFGGLCPPMLCLNSGGFFSSNNGFPWFVALQGSENRGVVFGVAVFFFFLASYPIESFVEPSCYLCV